MQTFAERKPLTQRTEIANSCKLVQQPNRTATTITQRNNAYTMIEFSDNEDQNDAG